MSETKNTKKVEASATTSNGHKVKADVTRLEAKYKETIVPNLMKKFEYQNIHQVPKMEKIVINIGVGVMLHKKRKDLKKLLKN